ncbi:sulfatase-like hydrolase/transferase [Ferroplasma sp.]|uniref:sulfatase family protein n=1 Tax=Ferroplasma sp. TaxID=2591003 RepID=UPI00261AD644|nr:sulfatase-like hydrolase/transferase [Ferroplasma sp.]
MKNRPNVVVIITDQENSNTISCYGGQLKTPNIDKLARNGVKFNKNYVTSPLCVPSRASIWTSMYPHQFIMNANLNRSNQIHVNDDGRETELPLDAITIGDLANKNGYLTGYFGKWHLGRENSSQHGFQVFQTELRGSYEQRMEEEKKIIFPKGYSRLDQQSMESFEFQEDTRMTDLAIEYIRNVRNSENPFFVVISLRFPHDPYTGPFNDLLDHKKLTLSDNIWDSLERKPISQRRGIGRDIFVKEIGKIKNSEGENKLRKIYARYLGLVHLVDLNVGHVLNELENLKLKEDTIVVFTSDHGDMMGSHELFFKGLTMYEEVTRVPLILSWDTHIPKGREVNTLTSMIDFTPTLLDLMKIPKPLSMMGESMRQLWDYSHNIRNAIFIELFESYGEWGPIFSIRTESYKYNWYIGDNDELYSMNNDPYELENLADKPESRDLIIGLREQIARWLIQSGDISVSQMIRTYPGKKPNWVSLGDKN